MKRPMPAHVLLAAAVSVAMPIVAHGQALPYGPKAEQPPRPAPPASVPPARNPDNLRSALCFMPARTALHEAHLAVPHALRPARAVLWLRYERDGSVVDARIDRSSGDERFDAVLVAWAAGLKLCPSVEPGEGKLPYQYYAG